MEVSAASGRGEEAFTWVLRSETPGTTIEEVQDSEDLPGLDIKLAAAVVKIAKGEVGRTLSRLAESLARTGQLLKGRQCLVVIYDQYRIDEAATGLYNITDLMSVKWMGDAKMELFLSNWESILTGMEEEPSENTKKLLFL
jgi:hypothetical protein